MTIDELKVFLKIKIKYLQAVKLRQRNDVKKITGYKMDSYQDVLNKIEETESVN